MDSKTFSQNYRRKLELEKKHKRNIFSERSSRNTIIFLVAATLILAFYPIVIKYALNLPI